MGSDGSKVKMSESEEISILRELLSFHENSANLANNIVEVEILELTRRISELETDNSALQQALNDAHDHGCPETWFFTFFPNFPNYLWNFQKFQNFRVIKF